MIGKRKRDHAAVPRKALQEHSAPDTVDPPPGVRDLLRKYFEERFEPLPQLPLSVKTETLPAITDENNGSDEEEIESDSTDWSGISETETSLDRVEVVEHETVHQIAPELGETSEGKHFMSSKPPISSNASFRSKLPSTKAVATNDDDDDLTDAANLRKDLALQRLLKESHLLDRQKQPSSSTAPPTTVDRHKIADLRMQAAGAKQSLFEQQKMPMSHRRGIQAKAATREETRRKEARENGVILEKVGMRGGKQKYQGAERRERGVGAPAVGKFVGGTLKLSRRDLFDINGPRSGGRGKARGRGRGRGRG